MPEQTMTENELTAFADKLEAFGHRLSPKEQALFLEILHRARVADDVQGYGAESAPKVSVPALQSLSAAT